MAAPPVKNDPMKSIAQMLVARKNKLATALPRHVTADRMIRVTLNSLTKNQKLLECTVESLWEAIVEASTYGWEIGGPVAQAYLVPYGQTATLVPGYRGLMDLARRSGQVDNVACDVVHEGDNFHMNDDPLDQRMIHGKSLDVDRHKKPITHVWAGYLLKNGSRVYEVMTAAEIDAHKKQFAKGWQKEDSAWQTSWAAMAKKTVIRKPIMDGRVPIAAEHTQLLARDEVLGTVENSVVTPIPSDTLGHRQVALPKKEEFHEPEGGEITQDEEWRLFTNQAAERMAKAKNLTQVNDVVEALNSEYVGDSHAKHTFDLAETRRAAIRAARGEKSR